MRATGRYCSLKMSLFSFTIDYSSSRFSSNTPPRPKRPSFVRISAIRGAITFTKNQSLLLLLTDDSRMSSMLRANYDTIHGCTNPSSSSRIPIISQPLFFFPLLPPSHHQAMRPLPEAAVHIRATQAAKVFGYYWWPFCSAPASPVESSLLY